MDKRRSLVIFVTLGAGCNGDGFMNPFDTETGTDSDGSTSSATDSGTTGTTGSSTTGTKLDVGQFPDVGGPPDPTCKVVDDMDAVGECGTEAPPNSFTPEVQWTWGGTNTSIIVSPIVANLTDDNGDGEIDLCDTPDVVVVTQGFPGGSIVVLDGATGTEHFTIPTPVASTVTPALGDIDNDGVPEIIAATPGAHRLVAFEQDGTLKWTGATTWTDDQGGAIAIADVDNDGFADILADGILATNAGGAVFQAPEQAGWAFLQKNVAPVAADLDNDDDLEIILGQAAYHHDGSQYYLVPEVKPGYPQVADLDDDGDPEILINNWDGITMLEHDGTVKFKDLRPTGDPVGVGNWFRPSTVHDFDDDGVSEFAVSSAAQYSVFEPLPAPTPKWSAPVQDGSGWAAGTAFDFLGDGEAEAMYADEVNLFVFNGMGTPVLTVPRSSSTLIEYPIVVDVDNDGSSEIIVVSNPDFDQNQTSPAVQVIKDAEDRWIQSRRIWNQHTYHVTNVREDGTIPQFEPKSWKLLNTFRTNAQIENGSVCKPPPEG